MTQVQAELLRKLKTPTAVKKACPPEECTEDLGKDSTKLHLVNFTAIYRKHLPLTPNSKAFFFFSTKADSKALS